VKFNYEVMILGKINKNSSKEIFPHLFIDCWMETELEVNIYSSSHSTLNKSFFRRPISVAVIIGDDFSYGAEKDEYFSQRIGLMLLTC
jgi:hypothetical protein